MFERESVCEQVHWCFHALHVAGESKSDSEASDVSGSDGEDTSWISWYCNLRGNEFFCEVDDDYIQDDFNLCGLSSQVPYYDYALDLILDIESSHGDIFTEEQNELVESAAEMLYGLIHARYILTSKGLAAMLEKYKNYDFGRCPRVYCCGQPCLPVGQSDIHRSSTVKIYCPKCEDIYYPRSKYQDIDGAYFGTTFPHLFLMTYDHLKPQKPSQRYVPRVFGFKLHNHKPWCGGEGKDKRPRKTTVRVQSPDHAAHPYCVPCLVYLTLKYWYKRRHETML